MASSGIQATTATLSRSFASRIALGLTVLLLGGGSGFAMSGSARSQSSPLLVPSCPATLAVQQSSTAPAGWTLGRFTDRPATLQGISFYDGPVSGLAELLPSDEYKRGGKDVSAWTFEGSRGPIYMKCFYGQTTIVLSRSLPSGVKQCTAGENSSTHVPDPTPVCR